jgi:hypothetical protein
VAAVPVSIVHEQNSIAEAVAVFGSEEESGHITQVRLPAATLRILKKSVDEKASIPIQ